ncbi:hypothetical protein [Cellulomonas composti]|uniref:Uncharacterized protein n=1 Tax=Cellulomonas composti TaxID=266130 RepID=A0A511JE18_9CELL|nr:hypothetical protein [Cellulomonas composti]GEL96225.1 hypothetical protein CCO02nite_28830 [Cellulomonas composti]
MTDIELSRGAFRQLITANPNYFGTLQDKALAQSFKVVDAKQSDTAYEEIGCVSYSPERDRLEATIVVRRAFGYKGGPCSAGSSEWVRFFVDFGAGWVDAGSAAARVFDVPDGKDCAGDADHPYVLVVGVVLNPLRRYCAAPVLPRVRAILSWEHEPPAGDPDFPPVWGEVQEDTVQVRPRRRFFPTDIGDLLAPLVKLDPAVLDKLIEEEVLGPPIPEPDPVGPVALNPQPLPPGGGGPDPVPFGLDKLVRLYAPDKLKVLSTRALDRQVAKLALAPVPPHRMAAAEVTASLHGPLAPLSLATAALAYQKLDIDWGGLVELLGDGKGDTTYEELECLGLDDAAAQLVATFRVKRPTGFSGPPCSAGSTEYVAFWADFDDDCVPTYLGTVAVSAHDYITMPATGLSYAAVLPLDLTAYRRLCQEPGLHRIRAVLSWNAPPSTTDPDAVPHWGNRLDTHVHVLPGRPYDGVARLTIVGGVATGEIDPGTGVTLPVAHIAYNGAVLDPRGCPFAGRVTVHGPADPALAGATYRLLVRDVTAGGVDTPVTTPFFVVDANGIGSWVTPGAGGWTTWPVWTTNTLGTLGYIDTSGDDLWQTSLEVQGTGVVDAQRFQLDNTLNAASVDPANAAHLAFDPGQLAQQGCGKFTQGMTIHGTYDARDTWFRAWGFSLLPFPLPSAALTTSVASTTSEAPVGSTWSLDTSSLQPCGYVLRLSVSDRAVVNSTWSGRSVPVDIGFCIE